MKVFISWSGDRSKKIAEVLPQWIPKVLQAAKPYYTPDDISKGARWQKEIAAELDAARVGLICLTPDNLESAWIMFEAGAISRQIDQTRVVPILFDVAPSDIKGPLVQFQAAPFSKAEMRKVVNMMNGELQDQALLPKDLDEVFEMWWPKLEEGVTTAMKQEKEQLKAAQRTEIDLLQEILVLTRALSLSDRTMDHIEVPEDQVVTLNRLCSSYRYACEQISALPPSSVASNVAQAVNVTAGALRAHIRSISLPGSSDRNMNHELDRGVALVNLWLQRASQSPMVSNSE